MYAQRCRQVTVRNNIIFIRVSPDLVIKRLTCKNCWEKTGVVVFGPVSIMLFTSMCEGDRTLTRFDLQRHTEILALSTYYYRLPTKLQAGNVFTRICLSVILSVHGGRVPMWPLPGPIQTCSPGPHHTTLDMFELGHLYLTIQGLPYPTPGTNGKPTLGLRLRCLLVWYSFTVALTKPF